MKRNGEEKGAVEREADAKEILRLVGQGLFEMTEHAFGRSSSRGITSGQIIHCARHCISHSWQEEHGTYLFVGYLDQEKNAGGFSAILHAGVVIVTVFRRRLTKWEKRRGKRYSKP